MPDGPCPDASLELIERSTPILCSALRSELSKLTTSGSHFRAVLRSEVADALRAELSALPGFSAKLERGELQSEAANPGCCGGHFRAVAGSGATCSDARCEAGPRARAQEREKSQVEDERSEGDEGAPGAAPATPASQGSPQAESACAQHKDAAGTDSAGLHGFAHEYFSEYVREVAENSHMSSVDSSAGKTRGQRAGEWLMRSIDMEEPPRRGVLANFMNGKLFEVIVCVVIVLNCGFMVHNADRALTRTGPSSDMEVIAEMAFQAFYSVELLLKLIVHRHYFFCNNNWRLNWFDLVLVIIGWVGMVGRGPGTGSFLRLVRLVKLGKAMRAVKIMAEFRFLRTFLVCLQGSLEPLLWSVVMLFMVFLIFSLFFVQMVEAHLRNEQIELEGKMAILFGSVGRSVMTLCKSALNDWTIAFEVISEVGWLGSVVFLVFVFFVQLALINIITGIFVDSAMQCLSPDHETLALELFRQEEEYANDLERLCRLYDPDFSNKLSPERFEESMKKERVPHLLQMLGLRTEHVKEFFTTLSELAAREGGKVDITEFVAGCMKLKGSATNFDLQKVHNEISAMSRLQEKSLRDIQTQLQELRGR